MVSMLTLSNKNDAEVLTTKRDSLSASAKLRKAAFTSSPSPSPHTDTMPYLVVPTASVYTKDP